LSWGKEYKKYFCLLKKIIAISFLFIMLYNIAGYYAVFRVLHIQVKKQVWKLRKSAIPEHELLLFSSVISSAPEFEWVNDHEFRYEGMLYDIIRISSAPSGDIWHCINDRQEEQMLQRLKQQVHQHNGQPAKSAKQLSKSLLKDFFIEYEEAKQVSDLPQRLFYPLSAALSDSYTEKDAPPPRTLFNV